jgi:hypothetical protein
MIVPPFVFPGLTFVSKTWPGARSYVLTGLPEAGLLNKSSFLAPALGVNKFRFVKYLILVTLLLSYLSLTKMFNKPTSGHGTTTPAGYCVTMLKVLGPCALHLSKQVVPIVTYYAKVLNC